MNNPKKDNKDQVHRFIEKARELGADESEERFNETLRRIGKAPVPQKGSKKAPTK